MRRVVLIAVLTLSPACGDDDGGPSDAGGPDDSSAEAEADAGDETEGETFVPAAENWERRVDHVALSIDMATFTGTAVIDVAAADAPGVSFEAGGLTVSAVSAPGGPLDFVATDGRLDVGVPAGVPATVTVTYGFVEQATFQGWSDRGWVIDWPWYCGNVFPCRSSPAEGQTFALEVTGTGTGTTAVHVDSVPTEAPAYQVSWAVGDYTYRTVGTTTAGTEVGVWTLPGGESAADTGMADVPAVFEWYESTLGPYPFGGRVGAVAVNWPAGAYGGIEHHPFWHVSLGAMADRSVHAHETAHGWFGNGVRIERWEDLVLSEGTVCYLAARALGQAVSADAEAAVWASYEAELAGIIAGRDRIAWPDPIADRVQLESFLFSRAPYMKGAFFYRAVAAEVGATVLDGVLARFFADHVGEAAGMQDLLDRIRTDTGFDPTALATGWLRSLGRPD